MLKNSKEAGPVVGQFEGPASFLLVRSCALFKICLRYGAHYNAVLKNSREAGPVVGQFEGPASFLLVRYLALCWLVLKTRCNSGYLATHMLIRDN